MLQKRDLASKFMLIGGISWIAFGISHLFMPMMLQWETALSTVPPTDIFGISISNRGVAYLFNADLFLSGILMGAISLLLAPSIRKGKRTAARYSIALGIYFIFRAGFQSYYLGPSLLDLFQVILSISYTAIYLFPLTHLSDFAEE